VAENLQLYVKQEIDFLANKRTQRPHLPISVSRAAFIGLYDTGADVCCIDEQAFKRVPEHLAPKLLNTKPGQFRAANGGMLTTNGKYLLTIQIGSRRLTHHFVLVKNLGVDMILGIDFIHRFHLNYDTETRGFFWKKSDEWKQGYVRAKKTIVLPRYSISVIQCDIRTESGCRPRPGVPCMVTIKHENRPSIQGGPALVVPDENGLVYVPVSNSNLLDLDLERHESIGFIENLEGCEMREIDPKFISSIATQEELSRRAAQPLTPEKEAFIRKAANLEHVPAGLRQAYLEVLLKNHTAVSQHKMDLGRTETLMHDIELKDEEPVYVKQFKIPDAHREEVEQHVAEWLKLGVVQPCRSKFNSPLFAVQKKNGGIRLVQDFRALNAKSMEDKYSMKDVQECIDEIGQSGSSLFTTIDLTAGFWQMILKPQVRHYTAFTVPGKGQFMWRATPMGLLGAPASFQRLMEKVVEDIRNTLVYIDDLLLHSSQHPDHLKLLDQVLARLSRHGIKMNLQKCVFGSPEVTYLGFQLTPEGIRPGKDKLKAVAEAQPPDNLHKVRSFLGLCNFFRAHVRNFAQVAAPLTELTRKDCPWKAGPLPDKALKAFKELKLALVSEPVLAYPRKGRKYALTTDASVGEENRPGGLGAILSQIDEDGNHHAIGYASRKLTDYEKNYTPFLLEMQGALWGIEHFKYYLKGRPFLLFTDHKPLTGLGKVHKRTHQRLTQAMLDYNFQLIYKNGDEMPADYLSRNVVNVIGWSNPELEDLQIRDDRIGWVKRFLVSQELPEDPTFRDSIKKAAEDCFIEDGLVWKRIRRPGNPNRTVVFLPRRLIPQVLAEAHGAALCGHDGIAKTRERILQCYYWTGMDADIQKHIQECHQCQVRRRKHPGEPPMLLTPLPQCTEPQQRVHADLFGPLKTETGKKYILCMTDAFTKYVELVALPNKESFTVATAIFEKWICRFGAPLEIITDQGKEFCSKLSKDLFQIMGISHSTTSAYHPQCNSQAEVANKTIAKYLASYVSESTLDWENYLAPMMFAYNTSFHRSIQNTPFFLTMGMEARQPLFDAAGVRLQMDGPMSPKELWERLQDAREKARMDNQDATADAREYHDRRAEPHHYVRDQLVLLQDPYFINRNAKIAPRWTGPHRIEELKGDTDVRLKMSSGRKMVTHVNRLKPYHVRDEEEALDEPDGHEAERPPTPPVPPRLPAPPPPRPAGPKPLPDPGSGPRMQDRPSMIQAHINSPKISALEQKRPELPILAGEGVQEIQQSLISENSDEENWILVVKRKKRKRKEPENLLIKDQRQLAKRQHANWLLTGDPIMTPLHKNEVLFEWYDTVASPQPAQPQLPDPGTPAPQAIYSPSQSVSDPPSPAVTPPSPGSESPSSSSSPIASGSGTGSRPSQDDSWRFSRSDSTESDDSTADPSYLPSSSQPSSSPINQADGQDDSIYEDCLSDKSVYDPPTPTPSAPPAPPVRPTFQLRPSVLAPPSNAGEYVTIPLVDIKKEFEEFNARLDACKNNPVPAAIKAPDPDSFEAFEARLDAAQVKPSPPVKTSGFGSLFSRSSRSQKKLPDSVLHQYPQERKKK
jgi:hypothetical protein